MTHRPDGLVLDVLALLRRALVVTSSSRTFSLSRLLVDVCRLQSRLDCGKAKRVIVSKSEFNLYAGEYLDRLAHLRGDKAWLQAALQDATTVLVPLWQARSLI